MKKKVEYTKSVVIASLIVSMALFLFGIYLIIKGGDNIQAILMIFLGLVTGLKEWINLFKKKKWAYLFIAFGFGFIYDFVFSGDKKDSK